MPGYVLPSLIESSTGGQIPEQLILDGQGWDPFPIATTLRLLEDHEFTEVLLPKDFNPDTDASSLKYLRSAFRFKIPVGNVQTSSSERKSNSEKATKSWKTFVIDTLLPELDRDRGPEEDLIFRAYFDGTDFQDLETVEALKGDMMLTIGSVVTVLAYVLFHTRSFLLTAAGIVVTLYSVPLSYVFCSILTGTNTVNFTAFLAVFLAVGFGCDVIFIYTDFWVESAKHFDDHALRLQWTYGHAGRASFVTTATTCLSFFANLVSVIRALRQFGFFMGLCVMLAWLLVTTIYAPLMVLDERIQWFRLHGGQVTQLGRHRAYLLSVWSDKISKYRRTLVATPCCLIVAGLIASAIMVKPASKGIPSLFPEGHNRMMIEEVEGKFEPMSNTAFKSDSLSLPDNVTVCEDRSIFEVDSRCVVYWCEVAGLGLSSSPSRDVGDCSCQRLQEPATCTSSQLAYVHLRLVTQSGDFAQRLKNVRSQPEDVDVFVSHLQSAQLGLDFGSNSITGSEEPSLVQHEWESGRISQYSVSGVQFRAERTDATLGGSSCGWSEFCTCGVARACGLDSTWAAAGSLVFETDEERRLEPESNRSLLVESSQAPHPRFLQITNPSTPTSKRTRVRIAFGLDVNTDFQLLGEKKPEEMWAYNEFFEARRPWSQRHMKDFCEDLLEKEELKVISQWCWFLNFRTYVQGLNPPLRFPVQAVQFDQLAQDFIKWGGSSTPGTKYVWLVDGVLRATYVSATIDLNKDAGGDAVLAMKDKWDKHLDAYNQAAVSTAKGAFHVSKVWVQAEANAELIGSAVATLVILLVLAFVFMVMFTWSLAMSLFVVGATMQAILVLTIFIIVIFQWEVGLIEIIAIVYFIGYAVTYSLHIAHKYASVEVHCHEEDGIQGGTTWDRQISPTLATSIARSSTFATSPTRDECHSLQTSIIAAPLDATTALPSDSGVAGTVRFAAPTYSEYSDRKGEFGLGAGVGPLESIPGENGDSRRDTYKSPERGRRGEHATVQRANVKFHRSKFALESMGGATLGSAATTAGSSVFLCFATLSIFNRLGTMCLTVTLISIVIALGPLPASLMLFGPERPGEGFIRSIMCIASCPSRCCCRSRQSPDDPGGSHNSSDFGSIDSMHTRNGDALSRRPTAEGVGKTVTHAVPMHEAASMASTASMASNTGNRRE
jgi:hypothetical protein